MWVDGLPASLRRPSGNFSWKCIGPRSGLTDIIPPEKNRKLWKQVHIRCVEAPRRFGTTGKDVLTSDGEEGTGDPWTLRFLLPESMDREDILPSSGDVQNLPSLRSSRGKDVVIRGTREQFKQLGGRTERDGGIGVLRQLFLQTLDAYEKSCNRSVPLPGGRRLDLGQRPAIMGILNVTPDSFSDAGQYFETDRAIERAGTLVEEGADIVDVGGESTRPGAEPVPVDRETERVRPVIEGIKARWDVPISIDTRKPQVAERAAEAGADMLNVVGGFQKNPDLPGVASTYGMPVIAMHMQGTPGTMQDHPSYECVVRDVMSYLRESIRRAMASGLSENQIIVDPGIGFGKTQEHNMKLLRDIHQFRSLGVPVMLGTSRKSFIGRILDLPVEERIEGSLASIAVPALRGTRILRVHDVHETRRFLQVLWNVNRSACSFESIVQSDQTRTEI